MIFLTGEESLSRLFGLDWQLLADSCLTIIAVFVLLFALSYFLFNPARKMLNARKDKIKNELDEAKENLDSAEKLKGEYEDRLKNVDKEAEEILIDAKRRAAANEDSIVAKAHEEATRIIERAKTEAELEKQRLADEVKNEMITVASAIAGKVVEGKIDASVQDQLIEDTLKEMGETTWQS
ncbi:MAG: F0F1 ATP synthase subunit B [Lachnospiraceae bacterium]|nr:F0F1 ATP synthase subunit B [Lachnospiraceae bacterium]